MSEIKTLRDLVGDYYSSLIDYKQDLHKKLEGQTLLIKLPVKDSFNPLPKKNQAIFYQSLAHLAVVDKSYQHFYFDKYQASNRFYLFSPGDEVELSFLSSKGHRLGTVQFTITTTNLAKYHNLAESTLVKPFLIKVIKKVELQEPDYQKQADQLQTSIKKNLADLLTNVESATSKKTRRIRLGRQNNGNINANLLKFFHALKINLPEAGELGQWQSLLDQSTINWGFKDIEELKALYQLIHNYENQANIMQGQLGLKTIFKRVREQVSHTTHDYQTMLQLIQELSQP
jgi:hypothetical protein